MMIILDIYVSFVMMFRKVCEIFKNNIFNF
jgi:hypothetical protein